MCTNARTRADQRLFFIGMALLAIGNSTHFFLQRTRFATENSVDAISGMLLGAAIGVLLLAIVRRNRGHDNR